VPEISAALDKVGLRWADFTETDNSCNAAESRLEELEADFVLVESKVASSAAPRRFGCISAISRRHRSATSRLCFGHISALNFGDSRPYSRPHLGSHFGDSLSRPHLGCTSSEVAGGFSTFEKLLVDDVVGLEKELVKDVVGIEREIVRDAKRVEAALEDDVAAVEAELQTAAQKGIPSLFKRR